MRILDVCCRWPGSAHDATIFAHSSLRERFVHGEFGNDSAILGDSAYAPDVFMCKPHANPVSESEKAYQYAQIRSRNVAERTFGVIKRRFPCLSIGMAYKRDKVQDVIVACCILHNFILKHYPQDIFQNDELAMDIARPIEREEIERQLDICEEFEQSQAISIQDFLINRYFNR